MKLYKITKSVFSYYRTKVKGNQDVTFEEAQKKLSRNIVQALEVDLEGNKKVHLYGNLHIFTKGNKITKIRNHWTRSNWFYKNPQEQRKLNEQLGLPNKPVECNEAGSMSYLEEYEKGLKNKI